MIIPIRSANSPYNPWLDINDDGKISLSDLVSLANSYGTTGTPLTKASMQYDSGWINITDKCGQNITVNLGLNVSDWNNENIGVDIMGKTTPSGDLHRNLGLTEQISGWGWSNTYGGTSIDDSSSAVQTGDGGYALAGGTYSFGAGLDDFWLVKTDASGSMQWNKTYGGTNDDGGCALVQTTDGGYGLAGFTYSFGAGAADFWFVKTDASGNVQWNKTYGGTDYDEAYALVQATDGGYALAGYTASFGAGGDDFWFVKTDASGNMQWNKTYGGTGREKAHALVQTADGGYALAGFTASFGAGNYDFWLVKTDASGSMQWSRTYGGANGDYARALVQTADGGYALAGYTASFGAGNYDFWLVKTDSSGNMQWNKTYGGTGNENAWALTQTTDGGYGLAGWTDSFGTGAADFWFVKTDAGGNMQWSRTYGGANGDYARALVQTADGGYALAGGTYSFGAGNDDSWLLKTDASGNIGAALEFGLAWVDSSANTVTLYRGAKDIYWNYVRVRLWMPRTP